MGLKNIIIEGDNMMFILVIEGGEQIYGRLNKVFMMLKFILS